MSSDYNNFFWGGKKKAGTPMYHYPIELEKRFMQAISGGRAEDALKVLETIYEDNFEKRTLTADRIEELFWEISSSLNKAKLLYLKDEEPMEYRISDFTVRSFFEYVKGYVYFLCEEVKKLEEQAYKTLFWEMLAYINENYANSELSLTFLAEEFDFANISYISRGFKSIVNENFSSYLERIRIEKACEMLHCGMQIKTVSEKVGYLSDVTFRRAFKKRMGLSPTDYVRKWNERQKIKSEK